MELRTPITFETDDAKRIYRFVERNGAVPVATAETELDIDSEAFTHELAILKRDGYLEEKDDSLRVALDVGEEEEHRLEGASTTIRPARHEDLSGIIGAIRQVTAERTYIVAESVVELLEYEGALIRHNNVQFRLFFVAIVKDEVVGWAHLEAPNVEKLKHTARLTIGVLEGYRDRGIGSHLLCRSLECAASNGCLKVYNSIPATNREAAAFLEAQGWDTEAIRRDHYRIDGEFVDELMMARSV